MVPRRSSELVCCQSVSPANSTLHVLLHCLARHRQLHLLVAAAELTYATLMVTEVLTVALASSAMSPTAKK